MCAGLVYSFLLGNIAATSLLSQHQNLRELHLLPSQTFRSLSVPPLEMTSHNEMEYVAYHEHLIIDLSLTRNRNTGLSRF